MFAKLFCLIAVFAALVQGNVVPGFPENRIIGGTDADITEYPYMASLRTLSNFHFCGGSILSNRWVLTAAHCTEGSAQNGINVVVGTSLRTAFGIVHRSSRFVMHPNYNPNNVRNDIALIEVSTSFVFGENVNAINLPTAYQGADTGQVSGWGYAQPWGPPSDQLQVLDVDILSHEACSWIGRYTDWFEPNKICSSTRFGQGHCFGDSGGPLSVSLSSGPNQVVGIVSFVFLPCGSTMPDVFERVYSHIDFIKTTTGIM